MEMKSLMFELPEFVTLAGQVNKTLSGKIICRGQLGHTPHKFVWYNRKPAEFEQLTEGKTVGAAHAKGKWLFVALDPGYVLLFGECGGKMLYHPAEAKRPAKYHLSLEFGDGSGFTPLSGAQAAATTQMWGAMELYEAGQEQERQYVKGMRVTPAEPEFTFDYFSALIAGEGKKRSAKSLLTQEQLVPGLGNAIAQDILFLARLHPRHPVDTLTKAQQRKLYSAIVKTVQAAIKKGGRYDEVDLFGQPGRYVRLMDQVATRRPCSACGGRVEKMAYLGGACYFCPQCQN
jgi:formamidopyrimidine-DNA glycosylase